MDCLFCKIAAGEIPATKVYEDGDMVAFLDIKPVNPGHVLVIPKAHYALLSETPDDVAAEMMKIVPSLGKAIMKATGTHGFNLMMNNGQDSGQLIGHVHMHIIPRHAGDGHEAWHGKDYADPDQMNNLANFIRSNMS